MCESVEHRYGLSKFLCCVLVIIVGAALLRIQHIINSPTLVHDEAISYLAATANQGAYWQVVENKIYPYGEWAQAADWQRFFQHHGKFEFFKIWQDLVAYDVHPPLYFWLLHLWILVIGVQIWSGALLNVIIGAVNILMLTLWVRPIFKEDYKSLAVGAIYAFSPGVMSATFLARSYELFTFFAILLLWGGRRLLFGEPKRFIFSGVVITSIVFLGLLTHYYFGIFASSMILAYAFCFFLSGQGKSGLFWKKFMTVSLSSVFGLLAMLLVHPGFFRQFFEFKGQGQHFAIVDLGLRFLKCGLALAGFFVQVSRRGAPPMSLILLLLIGIVFAFAFVKPLRNRVTKTPLHPLFNDQTHFLLLYLLIVVGVMALLYLSFFTHQAVMGPQYLSPIFPVFSLFSVVFLQRYGDKQQAMITVLVCLMVISAVFFAKPLRHYEAEKQKEIASAGSILIDNTRRGILPILMLHLPPDKKVYCAMQDDLLKKSEWFNGLKDKALYISVLEYGNTEEKRALLLNRIEGAFSTGFVSGGEWGLYGLGQTYLLQSKKRIEIISK